MVNIHIKVNTPKIHKTNIVDFREDILNSYVSKHPHRTASLPVFQYPVQHSRQASSNQRKMAPLHPGRDFVNSDMLQKLNSYIDSKGFSNVNQSIYRRLHSTETALLKIQNNIVASHDSGKAVALTLLDLSADFDTIDHNILFNGLRDWFGVDGTVLRWNKSYLSKCKQKVKLRNIFSDAFSLPYGVPQGFVLGHLLFTLYTIPLSNIISSFNVTHPLYADDTQI